MGVCNNFKGKIAPCEPRGTSNVFDHLFCFELRYFGEWVLIINEDAENKGGMNIPYLSGLFLIWE